MDGCQTGLGYEWRIEARSGCHGLYIGRSMGKNNFFSIVGAISRHVTIGKKFKLFSHRGAGQCINEPHQITEEERGEAFAG